MARPSVDLVSAGAAEHLLIAQVTNLVQTIRQLQRSDVWVVGMDLSQTALPLEQVDLDMPLGIVVGHEGLVDPIGVLVDEPLQGQHRQDGRGGTLCHHGAHRLE